MTLREIESTPTPLLRKRLAEIRNVRDPELQNEAKMINEEIYIREET